MCAGQQTRYADLRGKRARRIWNLQTGARRTRDYAAEAKFNNKNRDFIRGNHKEVARHGKVKPWADAGPELHELVKLDPKYQANRKAKEAINTALKSADKEEKKVLQEQLKVLDAEGISLQKEIMNEALTKQGEASEHALKGMGRLVIIGGVAYYTGGKGLKVYLAGRAAIAAGETALDPNFQKAVKNRDLVGAGDAALDHLPLVGDGRGFKKNLKEGNYVMAGLNAVGAVAEGIPFVKRWFGSGAKTVKQTQGVKQLEKQVAREVVGGGITAPKNWLVKASAKGGGVKYIDPKNSHNSIRKMPGNPNSPNSAQQQPYIKFMKDGKFYDRIGNPLPHGDSPAAHIPLNQFDPNKMPEF